MLTEKVFVVFEKKVSFVTREVDYQKVASKVREAHRKLGQTPPFDPEKVAESMGIRVLYANLAAPYDKKVSGYYRKRDNTIIINREISPARMVFTIAHELGHAMLHEEYIKSENYKPVFRTNKHLSRKPMEEMEADAFAANFLVPLSVLSRYKDLAEVGELADMFAVSEEVIENRLDLLRRHPSLARS